MNSIPKKSAKRLKAELDGTWKPKPRKPIKRTGLKRVAAGSPAASKLIKRAFGKGKKSERSKWKKKAWDQFSMFIRLRDADEFGVVSCVTCPAKKHWKLVDAGHFLTTAKEATKFDERNVHGQCKGCNQWQGGKFYEHEKAVDRIHGEGTVIALKQKAGQECKRTAFDYEGIAKFYAERVEWQKEHFPGKFIPKAA